MYRLRVCVCVCVPQAVMHWNRQSESVCTCLYLVWHDIKLVHTGLRTALHAH